MHACWNDLMEYTEWEREKWREWMRMSGDRVLQISAGPNSDGRFSTAGDLILHIFMAEKRYIEKLSDRPITDPNSVSRDSAEAIFAFGRMSRESLREFIHKFPAEKWDVIEEMCNPQIKAVVRASPAKIVTHVLIHEIRHWAQIATLLRINGSTVDLHDWIASPVMGGGLSPAS
jgi:uncharacterized damage-inducible protein DinB